MAAISGKPYLGSIHQFIDLACHMDGIHSDS